jgi:glyoxylase-like metal-dependent hydrolase (beta-lactamase superfamily II)
MKQELIQLTDNVWIWPHSSNPHRVQPSVGIIASNHRTALVDAGNSPSVIEKIRKAIQRANLPEVGCIIYTHHHWDHVYGACVFQVPIYAHEKCRAILLEETKKPWSAKYLDRLVARNPKLKMSCKAQARAIRDWDTFRITPPDRVFSTVEFIDLDGIQIELEHVGGKHAKDSIIVKVPQEKVMFLGDCFYVPPLHLRKPGDVSDIGMLKRMQNDSYDLYVEGHGVPFTR